MKPFHLVVFLLGFALTGSTQNINYTVEIVGYTDSDGSESFIQKLSKSRTKSSVNYINSKGIDSSRLVAKGYGESVPRESNATAEGKAQNRRVELKIIGK